MSRSALSNREQDRLLKEVKADALKKCDDVVRAFAECAKGRTISVSWACRADHKAMQECIKQYTSEEAFDRARREYLKQTRGAAAKQV